jgi:hypothetical protein
MREQELIVAHTLAKASRTFATSQKGSAAGFDFEQHLYHSLLPQLPWRHVVGPDQLDPGFPWTSHTGSIYEYDGMYVAQDAFYIVEAKHLVHGRITREIVSIFVYKLLDVFLGSIDEIGMRPVYPILVSAFPTIDLAAYYAALSWGILVISPYLLTPCDMLVAIKQLPTPTERVQESVKECQWLAERIWRPLQTVISKCDGQSSLFKLDAGQIYSLDVVREIYQQWEEYDNYVKSFPLAVF